MGGTAAALGGAIGALGCVVATGAVGFAAAALLSRAAAAAYTAGSLCKKFNMPPNGWAGCFGGSLGAGAASTLGGAATGVVSTFFSAGFEPNTLNRPPAGAEAGFSAAGLTLATVAGAGADGGVTFTGFSSDFADDENIPKSPFADEVTSLLATGVTVSTFAGATATSFGSSASIGRGEKKLANPGAAKGAAESPLFFGAAGAEGGATSTAFATGASTSVNST